MQHGGADTHNEPAARDLRHGNSFAPELFEKPVAKMIFIVSPRQKSRHVAEPDRIGNTSALRLCDFSQILFLRKKNRSPRSTRENTILDPIHIAKLPQLQASVHVENVPVGLNFDGYIADYI